MLITCAHQVFEPKLSAMVEVKLDHSQRGDATTRSWPGDVPPAGSQQLRASYRRQNGHSPLRAAVFGMNARASARCTSARFHLTQQSICTVPEQQTEMWNSCICDASWRQTSGPTRAHACPASLKPGSNTPASGNVVKDSLEWSAESADLTVGIQRQPAAWHQMLLPLFTATRQAQPRPRDPASQVTKGSN